MVIALPIIAVLLGIVLIAIALSDAPEHYPSPKLGRLSAAALALGYFGVASAAITSAYTDGWSDEWAARLLYGLGGMIASFLCVATGLYTLALAPGAHARQHPNHPSDVGERATRIAGKASTLFLLFLSGVALVATLYFVVALP